MEIGKTVSPKSLFYKTVIEEVYEKETESFYNASNLSLHSDYLSHTDFVSFLKKASQSLEDERQIGSIFLHPSSLSRSQQLCERVILLNHQDFLERHIINSLSSWYLFPGEESCHFYTTAPTSCSLPLSRKYSEEEAEREGKEIMQTVYNLLQISQGCLDVLCSSLNKFSQLLLQSFLSKGSPLPLPPRLTLARVDTLPDKQPKVFQWVIKVATVLSKLQQLINDCCQSDSRLLLVCEKAMRDALHSETTATYVPLYQPTATSVPNLMASFFDRLLSKDSKIPPTERPLTSEMQRDYLLQSGLRIFEWLQDKEQFRSSFHPLLCLRLLHFRSYSMDLEKKVVATFRVRSFVSLSFLFSLSFLSSLSPNFEHPLQPKETS